MIVQVRASDRQCRCVRVIVQVRVSDCAGARD